MPDGKVSAWSLNPRRTLIALKLTGARTRIGCWWLDPSGRMPEPAPVWTLAEDEPAAAWEILGWAGPTLLALWRRHPDRNELLVLDQHGGTEKLRQDVVGRPVAVRADRAGRFEIMLAVSDGRRPVLCSYRPHASAYHVLAETDGLRGLAAWDVDGGHLVVNIDPRYDSSDAVRLFRRDGTGYVRVDVGWPDGVSAAEAAGHGGDLVGLTGTGPSGRVPGVLRPRDRTVRWFPQHRGYTTVDLAPTGAHVLAAAWVEEGFRYRMLDAAGNRAGELNSFAGLATTLSCSRDELHVIGSFQSPVLPPVLGRWLWRDGDWLPLRGDGDRVPAAGMRWAHRWTPDPVHERLPEWLFEPAGEARRGTVLHLHGGPHGRLNQGYDPVIAGLVGRNWTVVGLNYPGSSGYGPGYLAGNRADWGGVDAEAVERRLRALHAETGGPVCLYGAGYGGYLALLAASRAPGCLAGVAVHAPMADLIRLVSNETGARRRWLEEELGELRFRPRELLARSPVSRLPELAALPLLIGHGRRDDRCPVTQSRQLVRLLESHSHPTGFVRYLEDPDGTTVPSNWDRWTDAVLTHFDQSGGRLALSAGGIGAAP